MTLSLLRRRALLPGVTAVALLCSLACGPGPRRVEPTNLFWPLPPDPPRIKYIESIYNEDDIGRVYSLKEKLFGKEYADSLVRPYGVSARKSKVLVADLGLRAVVVFNLATKRISVLGAEGALVLPADAVEAADGSIYVADAGGGRIVKYDSRGQYETAFRLEDARPVGIAINDDSGRLYVVDRASHMVVVCSLDGNRLFSFGGRGSTDGKFNVPLGVALDREGRVYVLDSGNFRVQIFTADGVFLSKFGEVGDRPGLLANPKGIALDSEEHVYVSDAAFSNFQIFDAQGNLRLYVGELGSAPGKFHLPGGVSIDENDHIYVADQLNGRLEVFQYLKAAEPEKKR